MIPHPWTALVLVAGAYRIVRLIGWDDFPLAVRARAWLVGAELHKAGSTNSRLGLTSEHTENVWVFKRPLLEHFLGCPFCQGFWVSCAVYVAWLDQPRWTLYGLAPFALSGAVGLIAKNLDP